VILSISRFDPKKNLALAIDALGAVRDVLPAQLFADVRLVLAGGYDSSFAEQRAVLDDLTRRASAQGLSDVVSFSLSPGDREREALLARCLCVVYTPAAEHFGYVPLEAMAAGRAVIAANVGGPTETVRNGETGLLCEPEPRAFGQALAELITNRRRSREMGRAGRRHVEQHFALEQFGARLERRIANVLHPARYGVTA
jgi:alpha-1,3/alpha-1,6-mannosyltransferase